MVVNKKILNFSFSAVPVFGTINDKPDGWDDVYDNVCEKAEEITAALDRLETAKEALDSSTVVNFQSCKAEFKAAYDDFVAFRRIDLDLGGLDPSDFTEAALQRRWCFSAVLKFISFTEIQINILDLEHMAPVGNFAI